MADLDFYGILFWTFSQMRLKNPPPKKEKPRRCGLDVLRTSFKDGQTYQILSTRFSFGIFSKVPKGAVFFLKNSFEKKTDQQINRTHLV